MKEKTSIFDEEDLIIEKPRKKVNVEKKILIKEKNNFWKYFLAFLLALFVFWLIWYFFLQNRINNNNTYKNYYNNGSDISVNKNISWENNFKNSWDLEQDLNSKDLKSLYKKFKVCAEGSQKLKEELEKMKQLIFLQKDLDTFVDNTNWNNLEDNFNKLKDKSKFLENEIIKKQKENDKDLKEIYEELNNSFWNKKTFASTNEWLWIETNDKDMSIIIPIDSKFPIKNSRTYYTRNSYQKRMEFEVYRWNDKLTKNNKFLWKFIITDLEAIEETWKRVEVTFDVDKTWKINFTAKDIIYPKNIINFYLDSEVDLLKKTNKDIEKIKSTFWNIENKVDKKIIKESQKDNIKILKTGEYKVEKVVDWDTFTFLLDWELVYARMIWIDAPEHSSLRYWYIELFSKESTNFLKEKVEWKTVKLEYDNSQAKIDKYWRHLVYVFLKDENINNTMILEWFAKEYTYNKKYKYSDLFKKSEKNAKNNKIWIWR